MNSYQFQFDVLSTKQTCSGLLSEPLNKGERRIRCEVIGAGMSSLAKEWQGIHGAIPGRGVGRTRICAGHLLGQSAGPPCLHLRRTASAVTSTSTLLQASTSCCYLCRRENNTDLFCKNDGDGHQQNSENESWCVLFFLLEIQPCCSSTH